MNKTIAFCFFVLAFSSFVMADTACGPFVIKWKAQDGLARVNGVRPETQKIIFLEKKEDYNNVKMQWMLADPNLGRWVGMDFVAKSGKPILNVEVIRKNMDEPRQFWTYDCKKKIIP